MSDTQSARLEITSFLMSWPSKMQKMESCTLYVISFPSHTDYPQFHHSDNASTGQAANPGNLKTPLQRDMSALEYYSMVSVCTWITTGERIALTLVIGISPLRCHLWRVYRIVCRPVPRRQARAQWAICHTLGTI